MAEDDEPTEVWSDGTPEAPVAPAPTSQPAAVSPPVSSSGPQTWLIAGGVVVALLVVVLVAVTIGRSMGTSKVAPPSAAASSASIATTAVSAASGVPADQQSDPQWRQCGGNDPNAAITACTAIITANSASPQDMVAAYDLRGWAYQATKQLPPALADFNAAVQIDPNNEESIRGQGQLLQQTNQVADSIAAFNKAIALNPQDALAFYGRAQAELKAGQTDAFAADLTTANKMDPNAQNSPEVQYAGTN